MLQRLRVFPQRVHGHSRIREAACRVDTGGVPSWKPLRVTVVGGGFAAAELLLALRALAEERVELQLVTPDTRLEFRPAAPGAPFGAARVETYDLAQLAADVGSRGPPRHRGSGGAAGSPRPPRVGCRRRLRRRRHRRRRARDRRRPGRRHVPRRP